MKAKIVQTIKTTFVGIGLTLITSPLWAMGQPPAGPDGKPASGGGMSLFIPMILVFVIFYFLLIRPQSKQRKKTQEMVNQLKKDDEVITSAGIHGRVTGITDNVITLEVAHNVRIKVERSSVAQLKTQSPAPQPQKS